MTCDCILRLAAENANEPRKSALERFSAASVFPPKYTDQELMDNGSGPCCAKFNDGDGRFCRTQRHGCRHPSRSLSFGLEAAAFLATAAYPNNGTLQVTSTTHLWSVLSALTTVVSLVV